MAAASDQTNVNEPAGGAGKLERYATLIALVFMALATLGSAWSGYQSSLWDGIQIFRLNDAAAFSRESNEKALSANQQRGLDGALFVEYARDMYEGNQDLAEFFRARMRPDLNHAIEAWTATHPRKNPDAPRTPFVMPEYHVAADDEARILDQKSVAAKEEGQKANVTSDTYTLLGVLYTTALFLAGLVASMREPLVRRVLLILSFINLVVASVMLLRLPAAHIG